VTDAFTRLSAALAGRYRLERELGAGGMATVYLAEDLKHDRRVAIKVLRPELAAVIGAERFLAEIRTTASLHHPHILPLYDSGQADALLYYVMPVVEGTSLRDRLRAQGQLPVNEAVALTVQVASALDYAHRRGVIHRDIKPENILIQEDQALVADFGVALATASAGSTRLTETGLSIGTPQYMSPEQALGERALDARCDIYAMGVTLYEMLTGAPPFTGASAQAIVARVITEAPTPPSHHRPDLPAGIDTAILTAIDKDPERRFQTAAALQAALTAGATTPPSTQSVTAVRGVARHQRWAWIGAAAALALALGGYVAWHRTGARAPGPPASIRSIAALPFDYYGEDSARDAYLAEGVPEEILGNLASVPELAVRPMPRDPRFRGHPDLPSIAGELHADVILTGSMSRNLDSTRVVIRPYDVARNSFLPTVAATGAAQNVFALEDTLARRLIASLKLGRNGAPALAGVRRTRPANPAAHDSVLMGQWYVERRDCASLDRAIALFTAATRIDSTYARAYADLAQTHNLRAAFFCARGIYEFVPARAAVDRALALDSTDANAHMTLGFMHLIDDWDWPGAGREFTRAVALDPTQANIWLFRTWYYVAIGHLDSALTTIRHAAALDPTSSIIRTRVGTILFYADSLDAAATELTGVLAREPTFRPAAAQLADVLAARGACDAALAQVRDTAVAAGGPGDWVWVKARCGKTAEARATVNGWEAEVARGEFVPPFQIAVAYAGLGNRAKVLEWLTRAVTERDWQLWALGIYPMLAPYRHDPTFRALLARVHLPVND